MATWKDLASDNRSASHEMFGHCRWRACISRAYYATFSEAVEELTLGGVTMPQKRSSPSHAKLPEMVGNNLTRLSHSIRWRLAGIIRKLYDLRIMADYVPSMPVAENDARLSLSLMDQVFCILRGESWVRRTR